MDEEFEGYVEVTAEEICDAVSRSLNPLSDHLVELLDEREVDEKSLTDSYLCWAAPTAILGRAVIDGLEPESDQVLDEVPGLRAVIEGCPEFDHAFKELLESPGDRELLLLAAASWMMVRGGCEELIAHIAESR